MDQDWRDGFPFLGNLLSLDFLNTRPLIDGSPVELLPDCASLARWLKAAGLVPARQAKRLERSWSARPGAGATMDQLREFRERLRQAVLQLEAGAAPSRTFLAEVNRLLAAHPQACEIIASDSGLVRRKRFAPESPVDVFTPILDSVAELLTLPGKSRLRKCGSCILHFYDTSKKGTRRWCSMSTCGNRAKVAAYAKRQRAGAST
jgi:predicted RNA-binding Zn ribbon-like protein